MCGTQARQQSATPMMLTSITLRHSATLISSKALSLIELNTAALFTRMSMRPKAFTVSAAMRSTSFSLLTSACTPSVRAPVALAISAAATSKLGKIGNDHGSAVDGEPAGKRPCRCRCRRR